MFVEALPQRRTGASSRVLCCIGITAVAVACVTDDVASPSSGPGGERVRDGAADAGSCPAPGPNGGAGLPEVWARSPTTGECCRYESASPAPRGWPYFETEAECQSSCRCSVLEGFYEPIGWHMRERTSIECRCSAETCPSTIAEAEQQLCSRSSHVVRSEGCGRVLIEYANGATGESWVFERSLASADAGGAGERLIGAVQFSDVPLGPPCQVFEWFAGSNLDCDDVTSCLVCGEDTAASPTPPCE